ncbi:MAG: SMP-30/gluconolactonase/LRE family protein [Sedimentisphaerales bacterium]|nr:SMP-30/gluconolactonase/LRE family protein [Sedimentisphaerales bacterium]
MKTRQDIEQRSIRFVIALTLTLIVLGLAQVTLGAFPGFTQTTGVPEGVAVGRAGNVYVSVAAATSDQVWKFSPSGVGTLLSDLGEPTGGAAGLAVDSAGDVYMCRAIMNPGVYRITPDGEAVKLPGTEQIAAANALAFDNQETLYVTETFSGDLASADFGQGGIWCIPKGGTAQLWLRDELLTGLPPALFPYPVGANGIGFHHNDLYVANTDKGLVVRIPVLQDGSPGPAEVWKTVEDVPESPLYQSPAFPVMLDGLTIDTNGNVYVAVVSRNAIVRIDADDRSQETVAVYPVCPLDAPASLALGTRADTLFITNLGMYEGLVPNPVPWPGPGLVWTALSHEVDPTGIWTGRQARGAAGEEQMAWVEVIGEEKNGISTVVMKVLNADPTLFGLFPDATTRTDSVGSWLRTGPDTWDYTYIGYGTTDTHEAGYGDVVWMLVYRGTATATDSDTIVATGRAEVYSGRDDPNHTLGELHDQDTDPRDGFPDVDEEPIFSTDFEVTEYRMPMLPAPGAGL